MGLCVLEKGPGKAEALKKNCLMSPCYDVQTPGSLVWAPFLIVIFYTKAACSFTKCFHTHDFIPCAFSGLTFLKMPLRREAYWTPVS